LAEAGPSQFPVDANIANAQRKVINNKIYDADATNSPTIIKAPRIDERA